MLRGKRKPVDAAVGYVRGVAERLEVRREDVSLACLDFGGSGDSLLLLHGLAGHSGEWRRLVETIGRNVRIVAMDQRGHGRSERAPRDRSRRAFVADVAAVVQQLSLAPVVLIGQSMGGNTAFLAAAAYPELVDRLVVVEASPDGPAPELPPRIRSWLESWPVPFSDEGTAREFFSAQGLAPTPWTAGLERRDDGLWPAFNADVLVDCIAQLAANDYWSEWRRIRCPTLIVRGQQGNFEANHIAELAHELPHAQDVTIPDARHDVHLDAPDRLAQEIRRFLD